MTCLVLCGLQNIQVSGCIGCLLEAQLLYITPDALHSLSSLLWCSFGATPASLCTSHLSSYSCLLTNHAGAST